MGKCTGGLLSVALSLVPPIWEPAATHSHFPLPTASAYGTEGSLLFIEKYTSLKVEGAWESSGSISLLLQIGKDLEGRGLDQDCTGNQSVVEIVLEVKSPGSLFFPVYYIVNLTFIECLLCGRYCFKCFICIIPKLYFIDLETEAGRNHPDLL